MPLPDRGRCADGAKPAVGSQGAIYRRSWELVEAWRTQDREEMSKLSLDPKLAGAGQRWWAAVVDGAVQLQH